MESSSQITSINTKTWFSYSPDALLAANQVLKQWKQLPNP